MVEYSLECLKNLAVSEVAVEELVEAGVLDVFFMNSSPQRNKLITFCRLQSILKVMRLNPYNERIIELVCAFDGNFLHIS